MPSASLRKLTSSGLNAFNFLPKVIIFPPLYYWLSSPLEEVFALLCKPNLSTSSLDSTSCSSPRISPSARVELSVSRSFFYPFPFHCFVVLPQSFQELKRKKTPSNFYSPIVTPWSFSCACPASLMDSRLCRTPGECPCHSSIRVARFLSTHAPQSGLLPRTFLTSLR